MQKQIEAGRKPHYLRRMKDIAEIVPAGTFIKYAAMAEKRRSK